MQERLLQLNDAISTNLVKQQEQEAAIRVLESTENKQATEVVQATERLERLEKDIQERLKAIQLKEADQKTRVLQVENWSAALKALYSAETIRKSDEARGKEYQQQEKKLAKEVEALKRQRETLEKAQEDLAVLIEEQETNKTALEQELADNQATLTVLKAEEEQQAAARQAEQTALLANLAQTPQLEEAGGSTERSAEGQQQAQQILLSAKEFLGVPYVWGGTTPSGFDCSGLMQYVFAKHGVTLPRVSQAQQAFARNISLSELRPGDLVFWGQPAYHVGLYMGDGYFIHAPQPGRSSRSPMSAGFPTKVREECWNDRLSNSKAVAGKLAEYFSPPLFVLCELLHYGDYYDFCQCSLTRAGEPPVFFKAGGGFGGNPSLLGLHHTTRGVANDRKSIQGAGKCRVCHLCLARCGLKAADPGIWVRL